MRSETKNYGTPYINALWSETKDYEGWIEEKWPYRPIQPAMSLSIIGPS
jgi:hypothetical protein